MVSVYIIFPNPALPVAHRSIYRLEFGTELFPGYYNCYSFSVAKNHRFSKLLEPKKPLKGEGKKKRQQPFNSHGTDLSSSSFDSILFPKHLKHSES